MESKIFTWEGSEYKIDLDAPAGERVLVKEGETFVSKPNLGKLGATILFEGMPVNKEDLESK
ncbi:MAG: hypothetical protein PHY40_03395 [Patescibacteria group bacterium]|nr:hypothetical protein [Patescibacteria group bacterium]